MAFSDHFVGVPQSRWTGYAILAAIIAVSLAILFGKERIPLGTRVLVILLMILFALPAIVLVLFQLTCLVNGTKKAPYCGWYAWVVAAITIVYCVLLIFVAITSKMTDENADKVEQFAGEMDVANQVADNILKQVGGDVAELGDNVELEKKKSEDIDPKDEPVEKSKEAFVVTDSAKHVVENVEKKKKIEKFADYGFGAAPISDKADMYML